jgi:hypothetical protein
LQGLVRFVSVKWSIVGFASVSDRHRFGALAASAVLLGCALAGCTDDAPEPEPLPSPAASSAPTASASASASPSPASGPPTMPPEARGTSRASAEAFVRHWVDSLNYSGPQGDTASLRRLSTADCIDCDAIADAIDRVHDQGGSIAGRGWAVLRMDSTRGAGNSEWIVRTRTRVHPQAVVTQRGERPQRFRGGTRLKIFGVARVDQSWRVINLDQSSG